MRSGGGSCHERPSSGKTFKFHFNHGGGVRKRGHADAGAGRGAGQPRAAFPGTGTFRGAGGIPFLRNAAENPLERPSNASFWPMSVRKTVIFATCSGANPASARIPRIFPSTVRDCS